MIVIKAVSKHYGDLQALKQVNISIEEGICFGLVGPNGAGKSTLMKILAGIIDDFKGEIQITGRSIQRHRQDFQRVIGYVPQDICLEDKLTAWDNLHFFGRLYGLSGKPLRRRVEEILDLVGLAERKKEMIATYSGGMKRRINIGCALLHSPSFIIMDEPTVGVDPQSRHHIFELIHTLKQQGKTILYSSHYMEEVQNLCDAIALIDKGEVIESGSIPHILNKYSTPSIYVQGEGLHEETLQEFGHMTPKKEGYVLDIENPLQAFDSLSQYFLKNNVHVHRFELAKPTLEDVFLSLTGSSLRDE